jgi:predicted secreted protein
MDYILPAIFTFLVIWVIVFFMALPMGVRVHYEEGSGNASSAPEKSYIGYKLLGSVIIAIVITLMLAYFYDIKKLFIWR